MSEETNAGLEGAEGGDAGGAGNEGGGVSPETPSWMNSMPDAYKQNEGFAKFGEAADAYAKFDELLKADGDALKIPGEDATDEERNAFFSKMGRPDAPEGYEIAKPEGWPEGVPYDDNLDSAFMQEAFKLGVPADTAKNLHGWWNNMVMETHKAEQAATEKAVNDLKDKWPGDQFKEKMTLAERAFNKFGNEDTDAFLENTKIDGKPLGSHPMFVSLFAEIASKIGDDDLNTGDGGGRSVILSEEDKAKGRFPNTEF